ncbi:MAG: hypothetical protein IPJ23_02785 [Ignavibacteriales bacterium]|nr:hypothetical protein [Ignavibacteriales bacterium]
MNRKIFFTSISLGAVGFAIYNSFPMKYFSKQSGILKNKIEVKINPLAVSRKKVGEKNV